MNATDLLKSLAAAGRRAHLIGDDDAGVVVALDVEGRWFAVLGGEVLNRVNPEALSGHSTRERYINPGGDGLWPAPEGSTLGHQYATGPWRVPPGLTSARYLLLKASPRQASIRAEVDLVNNLGVGAPTLFQRDIRIVPGWRSLTVQVVERITYIGRRELAPSEYLLAPWTLCQFDCGPGCEVVFPCDDRSYVWDLYDEPSDGERSWHGRLCRTRTDGSLRYQVGIDARVPWIEYRDPGRGLAVRRSIRPLPEGRSHIDIRDAPPDAPPGDRGVRYSVYSDPTGFMEIEAAGGGPAAMSPQTEVSVSVSTRFTRA